MTGYELSREWFDWCFENPEKIKPNHSALYFFIIEHCNRLGWKEKFGLPSSMTMEAIGIKSYNTYIRALNDIIEWGFVEMIEKSKNQYSSNIIALSKSDKALNKALDKSIINHTSKQSESIDSINKPDNHLTNKPKNKREKFTPPELYEVEQFIMDKNYQTVNPKKFWNHYESNGWMVGKNKMKDWKAAVRKWNATDNNHLNNNQNDQKNQQEPRVNGQTITSATKNSIGFG